MPDNSMPFDTNEAIDFLSAFDSYREGNFQFQHIHDKDDRALQPQHLKLADIAQLVPRAQQGFGTFFTVNEMVPGARRTAENVERIRAVYADDDVVREHGYRDDWKLPPSIIVQTSAGKYHYYWLIEDEMSIDTAEAVKKSIAETYGTDWAGVAGPNRVLRVPGFPHQKGDKPFVSKYVGTMHKYKAQEIIDAFETSPLVPKTGKGDFEGEDYEGLMTLNAFIARDWVIRKSSDTEHTYKVVCPWHGEHTDPTDRHASFLFAGTGGYVHQTFHCHHDSCLDRSNKDIMDYFGLDVSGVLDQMENIDDFAKVGDLTAFKDKTPDNMKPMSLPDVSDDWGLGDVEVLDEFSSVVDLAAFKEKPKADVETESNVIHVNFGLKKQPSDTSTFASIHQLNHTQAKFNWLIKGFLERDTLSMLFGDYGTFKSFIMVDIAVHVALGQHWDGRETLRGPVILFVGEGKNGMARRVQAWSKYYGVDFERDTPFVMSKKAINLGDPASVVDMVEEVENLFTVAPIFIGIDTLHRSTPGLDENSSKDMGVAIQNMDALKHRYAAAVMATHHTGRANKDRARGSSALDGAMDNIFHVDADGMGVDITCTKIKDGRRPDPIRLTAHEQLIGSDDEGDDITSLVMLHGDDTPGESFIRGLKVHGITELAVRVLVEHDGKMDAHEWAKEVKGRCENTQPDKAFKVARDRLFSRGLIDGERTVNLVGYSGTLFPDLG